MVARLEDLQQQILMQHSVQEPLFLEKYVHSTIGTSGRDTITIFSTAELGGHVKREEHPYFPSLDYEVWTYYALDIPARFFSQKEMFTAHAEGILAHLTSQDSQQIALFTKVENIFQVRNHNEQGTLSLLVQLPENLPRFTYNELDIRAGFQFKLSLPPAKLFAKMRIDEPRAEKVINSFLKMMTANLASYAQNNVMDAHFPSRLLKAAKWMFQEEGIPYWEYAPVSEK